jgi:hypothetical protein
MGCSRLAMPSPSGLVLLGLLFLSGIGLAPVPVSATEDKGIAVSRGEAGPPASNRLRGAPGGTDGGIGFRCVRDQ